MMIAKRGLHLRPSSPNAISYIGPMTGITAHPGFNTCAVALIFREARPFGEHVEGLSYYWRKTYSIDCAVQTDFDNSTLDRAVRRKPFLPQGFTRDQTICRAA